jgi:hypothetical protein
MSKIEVPFMGKNGNAILVTGRESPQGFKTSRLPHFLENRPTDGVDVVSLIHRTPFTLTKISGSQFCYRLS